MRDKAPAQWVKRREAGFVIAPDHHQVLAGCGIPSGRIVVRAAVTHIRAFDDAVAQRPTALDDPPAHAVYVANPVLMSNGRAYRGS